MNKQTELIEKLEELIANQRTLINFISIWGKFADLLHSDPLSAKFISRQLQKIRESRESLDKLEREISALKSQEGEEQPVQTAKEWFNNWQIERQVHPKHGLLQYKSLIIELLEEYKQQKS